MALTLVSKYSLLPVVFRIVVLLVCFEHNRSLRFGGSLSNYGSRSLYYRTRRNKPDIGALKTEKLIPLNYDETFAYGCLHDIPIPNSTLETTFTPQQERAVLMEIFNQTAGHSWRNNAHWANNSVPHCLWYGITCDQTNSYIISITLIENNLDGTLPKSLWKLRNLQGLCIGNNDRLSGNLIEILSANMTTLLRLDLAFNKLSGKIPGDILPKMESLVKVQLCCQLGKGLSGEIPRDIGNLTELQVLSLGENRLNGMIPKSIAKLKKLWFLDLESVKFLNGGFENMYNLSSLRYMHLSLAGLKGTLPDEFGLYFPAMIECLLPGNLFTGGIPSTMGNMTNLWHLNLANNDFSGKIPKDLGSIPMLQVADFSRNQLSGLQEGIVFKSKSLEVLNLAGNKQLNMTFNSLLEAMEPVNQSLRILNISECNFLGKISPKLWDFQNLISVDLSGNSLFGQLPSPPDNMLFLLNLDVSANNLSGQIPQEFAKLLALEVFDISLNPNMHESNEESGTVPNFVTVDFKTLTKRNSDDKFRCPNARLSYNKGLVVLDPNYYFYRLCLCDIGYFGSGRTCLPCMEGGVCHDQMLPTQSMIIKEGYWPSSLHKNVTHLVRCSQALGTSPHVNTTCNPTGACECEIDPDWLKETNGAIDRPSITCDKSCLCQKGSRDRFCSLCEHDYYKQGILCYACRKSEASVYIIVVLLILTILFIILGFFFYKKKRLLSVTFVFSQIIILTILAMLQIIPPWLLELNIIALFIGLAGRGKTARGIMKTTVFYFQTFDALLSNNDVWPVEVLEMQRYIGNVFNFRFSGLACEFPSLFTPLGELASLLILPLICILLVWLYFILGCLALKIFEPHNSEERRFRLRNTCLQLSIMTLNFTYFPIVKKTASILAHCGEDNGQRYLREAPWMECEGSDYTVLQVLGWLALPLYVIGVPFGVFLPLLRFNNLARRHGLPQQDQESLDSWLGSIYLPYKEEFRSFFEIIFLLRRMLIAFALSLITRASSFQTIAVCFVLLSALCLQLSLRPFNDSYKNFPLENTAETLVLLTLHFSFMNVRYASLNPDSSTPIVWMIVVVNAVLICGMVVSIILLLKKAENADGGHEERAPVLGNGAGEQYGTFEE
ncbi:putative leucine-rich repeat-containing protein DDB_G0281931 [Stylophora pistillata]|uniref:putative leucine-rich repeat-containing protein DDB_G0281931 n=1 Tax=Stylophora pistillata TaxID=50429 RepID=UPI000C03CA0E|nr:putative leucine-rich repeat-containing protein DDB_G0281931 [Stylophora pistillata]